MSKSPAQSILRPHAEQEFAHELAALAKADDRERPPSWKLSPWAVVNYLLGGKFKGFEIEPKYYGSRRLIEVAVATPMLGVTRVGEVSTTNLVPVPV